MMTRAIAFTRRHSAPGAALLGLAALVGLVPLVLDQFVLFADPERRAAAAGARIAMAWPATALVAAALLLAADGRRGASMVTALPLSAVALAWLVPDTAYPLLALILSGPAAAGACVFVLTGSSTAGRWIILLAVVCVSVATALVSPLVAAALLLGGGLAGSLRREPRAGSSPAG